MADKRERLASRRRATGLTQEQLAARLKVERITIYRWEAGHATPRPEQQPKLARALKISAAELADLLSVDRADVRRPVRHADILGLTRGTGAEFDESSCQLGGHVNMLEPSWSSAETMQFLRQVAGGFMDRRGFLIITGSALAGLADQWGSAVNGAPLPLAFPKRHRGRLSATILDRLDHRLADLRRLDDALGGCELHQLAAAEFRWLTRLADQAVVDEGSGHRLFSLVTEAARLCGWLHFDASHHAAAQYYYVAALRSSASAGDSLAGAHVLACMAFQATLSGQHQDALALIDSAEEQTKHTATPRLRALLASRKARAYAKGGDARRCGHALNEAERRLDETTAATLEPDWIYYFDHSELTAQAAACWVDLRHPNKARPLIDAALISMDPHYVRDRAIYQVRSAEAHLHTNDLEPACDDLHTAVQLARHTHSMRSVDTIRSARLKMTRYNREPRVEELDRSLTNLAGNTYA